MMPEVIQKIKMHIQATIYRIWNNIRCDDASKLLGEFLLLSLLCGLNYRWQWQKS